MRFRHPCHQFSKRFMTFCCCVTNQEEQRITAILLPCNHNRWPFDFEILLRLWHYQTRTFSRHTISELSTQTGRRGGMLARDLDPWPFDLRVVCDFWRSSPTTAGQADNSVKPSQTTALRCITRRRRRLRPPTTNRADSAAAGPGLSRPKHSERQW